LRGKASGIVLLGKIAFVLPIHPRRHTRDEGIGAALLLPNPTKHNTTSVMKDLQFTICASIAVLLFPAMATAWSGAGHQVIAAEAYRQLTPDLKNWKVEKLIDAGLGADGFAWVRAV
jgi:hypothetical protein